MRFRKEYFVGELLSIVNCDDSFIGNKNCIVSGFCDDFFAKEGDLTWTDSSSILNKLLATQDCLTIITDLRVEKEYDNKNIIRSNNPLRLFEMIVSCCFNRIEKDIVIGQHSLVHNTVVIGKNVRIGENCKIAPYVVIGDNVTIGNNVEIGSFSTIGNAPYYTLWDKNKRLRNRNVYGCVIIGNNVHIGSYCSIDNGITIETEIGTGCKLGNFVEIGHDVRIGNNCCICAQTAIGGLVTIGDDCVFWSRAGVANRINIAPRTTILASSILTKSISKTGQTLCGFPAIDRTKHWKNIARERKK